MTAPTIVIVGAGFSGVATAVQLLRQAARPVKVVLVNESGRMARGLAYGTRSPLHVLNVPAGNMSALADEPDDFLRYCRWAQARWGPGSFVPRRMYGAYLAALLDAAECGHADAEVGFERVVGRVVAAHAPVAGGQARVELEGGRSIDASRVVLAFGHFPSESPFDAPQQATLGDAYVADPWRADWAARVTPQARVLLVGSGLTALDMLITLQAAGHRGPVLMLSRRGLRLQPHREHPARPVAPDVAPLLDSLGAPLRQQVAALRAVLRDATAAGADWRDCIAALRPHMPRWWQGLGAADRARFLRHLQAHWDVARHRCAPSAHATFAALEDEGRLRLLAGRVAGVERSAAGIRVAVRPRGSGQPTWHHVDCVVNCTAPSGRLERSGSALVRSLLGSGNLVSDALGLGLLVDADYSVMPATGEPQPWLRYVGPLLRARDWEATAVPELRLHAQRLAGLLLREIGGPP